MLFILAVLLAVAVGAASLADNPGMLTYDWRGSQGSITTTEAAAWLAAAALVLLTVAELLRTVWRLPERARARRVRKRQARGLDALSKGLAAVGVGDKKAARRAAQDALANLKGNPAALFLAAQTAQLEGDRARAERVFSALAERAETATLGARGLYIEAARAGDHGAALSHARAALDLDNSLEWAASAVFEAAAAAGEFDEALAQLDRNLKARIIEKARHRRLRAVLLTQVARGTADPAAARQAALEAHQLAKDLVPAAVLASAAAADKNRRQAAQILEDAYKRTPHPDLFSAALELEGPLADARLQRAQAFAALRSDHLESALGLARAALSARRPDLARAALAPHLDENATQRVCILMAELEALAPGDEGRVRDWLARAVRAPRDPQWIADGVIAASWAPFSPVTGEIDAFEWRVPPVICDPPTLSIDLPQVLDAPANDLPPPLPGPSVPQS